MLLSELETSQSAVIAKVSGHGAFRKRITEMGFVKGVEVEAILNAPLKDPVKYRILDFEVSLRREDAAKIEVVTQQEADQFHTQNEVLTPLDCQGCATDRERMEKLVSLKSKTINVALVGNPNCGKTSIFNVAAHAHERVGNYSGVTVEQKVGTFNYKGYKFNLIDLPGTYSLSAYSPEELYVRKYIIDSSPDIILNVVDASNLERNLYLSTQIIDMNTRVVMALNMFDQLQISGDKLDYQTLGQLLGVPIVPTTARNGEGINELFDKIINVYEGKDETSHHIHINHGQEIEQHIRQLRDMVYNAGFDHHTSTRFIAIKLLENDSQIEEMVHTHEGSEDIIAKRDEIRTQWQHKNREEIESAITDAKYGFIRGAVKEVLKKNEKRNPNRVTEMIDAVATNKYLGYPIFLLCIFVTFWLTFSLGQYPMDWIDGLFAWLGDKVDGAMSEGVLKSLIVDGLIGGVGSVIVFLPNILILYFCISLMEDSGYMARTAFIMDKIMHRMGLHGKSFIPMIMGFGCNIPAIMATRTIEDRKSRLITMLIIPLMSCSARIPVYLILVGTFFTKYAALVLFSLYLLGMVLSIIMAKIFSKFVVKGESMPFVMELPPYRKPAMKNLLRHTWAKGKQYLRKMGMVILGASVIVWALGYFPNHDMYPDAKTQLENSYMGKIGKVIEPIMQPCGLDWRQSVSLLTGVAAKEIVGSTMGVLYSAEDNGNQETLSQSEEDQQMRISKHIKNNMTPLSAAAMLVFTLLYMPCLAGVIAIKNESGKLKWMFFVIGYTILLAWIMSFLVFQIGSFFM